MSEKRMRQIEQRIERIKAELVKLPAVMRPGSLTRQYSNPGKRKGAYWQVSYTRNMQSKTEYVRPELVSSIRDQIAAYKRIRKLVDEWIDLGIEASKLSMRNDEKGSG